MKYQIQHEASEAKTRHQLYKELTNNPETSLLLKQTELLQKANLRMYCEQCGRQITRQAHIISQNYYSCIPCFANLDQNPQEYLTRNSLMFSFSEKNWGLMDEVLLNHGFQLWGYGNWPQIKQYMDYNASPFSKQEIENHYEKYYLNTEDQLPVFPDQLLHTNIKNYVQKNNKLFDNDVALNESIPNLKKNSISEKKISVQEKTIKPQQVSENQSKSDQSESEQVNSHQNENKKKHRHALTVTDSSILGYNPKRKQFELGEYDYNAQTMLADLQFYENDSTEEFELKLKIIDRYNYRLNERLNHREFVVEHRLLDQHYLFSEKEALQSAQNKKLQPYRRFAKNQVHYMEIIKNYSIIHKHEEYLHSLIKMRQHFTRDTNIESAFNYLKIKKEKIARTKKFSNSQPRKIYHRDKTTNNLLQTKRNPSKPELTVPLTPKQVLQIERMIEEKEDNFLMDGINVKKISP